MMRGMLWLELSCVAILALYAWLHREEPGWLREVAWLAVAALVGEDSCIRLYGFYQYAPGWHLRVDHVPVLIAVIWPAVVLSARTIARVLLAGRGGPAALALLTGALVVFDASLIEPIAVAAGLWSWNEPGVFGVPVVGILGWGFFAAAATWLLERLPVRAQGAVALIAPLATHAMLLVAWWGLFRWTLRTPVAPAIAVGAVAAASLAYSVAVRLRRAGQPRYETLSRVAATAFFAALLARHFEAGLLAYAAAFVPPHLVLSAQGWSRKAPVEEPTKARAA